MSDRLDMMFDFNYVQPDALVGDYTHTHPVEHIDFNRGVHDSMRPTISGDYQQTYDDTGGSTNSGSYSGQ